MSGDQQPIPGRRLLPLATAGVWLHQGLWCKVLERDRSHRAVIESLPGLVGRHGRDVTRGLGLAESALAILVGLRGDRRLVAAIETGAVVAFNLGGLAVGRAHIAHPGRLLARNAAFIGAIWAGVR